MYQFCRFNFPPFQVRQNIYSFINQLRRQVLFFHFRFRNTGHFPKRHLGCEGTILVTIIAILLTGRSISFSSVHFRIIKWHAAALAKIICVHNSEFRSKITGFCILKNITSYKLKFLPGMIMVIQPAYFSLPLVLTWANFLKPDTHA